MSDGIVVVDKPPGPTSHDVVARGRRIAGTRRVGHAGTLDPMATGVLVLGIGRATRLLGHLASTDKEYDATIRLGVTTTTDDAAGEPLERRDASGVTDSALAAAMATLTGDLEQVPAAVSAVKLGGKRAYARVRAGESVQLAPRPVRVDSFDLLDRREGDLDVHVCCSTGTYVRALARDLGAVLGVGAHLSALRRTRVGRFTLAEALTLEQWEQQPQPVSLDDAVARCFPRLDLDRQQAERVAHGQRLALEVPPGETVGVFDPDGHVVALVRDRSGVAQPLCVFA